MTTLILGAVLLALYWGAAWYFTSDRYFFSLEVPKFQPTQYQYRRLSPQMIRELKDPFYLANVTHNNEVFHKGEEVSLIGLDYVPHTARFVLDGFDKKGKARIKVYEGTRVVDTEYAHVRNLRALDHQDLN